MWEGFLDADAYDEVEAKECKCETYVLEGTSESISGGALRPGGHTRCAWSPSQKVVALSSCESECSSLARCAGEAMGLRETPKETQLAYSIRFLDGSERCTRPGAADWRRSD